MLSLSLNPDPSVPQGGCGWARAGHTVVGGPGRCHVRGDLFTTAPQPRGDVCCFKGHRPHQGHPRRFILTESFPISGRPDSAPCLLLVIVTLMPPVSQQFGLVSAGLSFLPLCPCHMHRKYVPLVSPASHTTLSRLLQDLLGVPTCPSGPTSGSASQPPHLCHVAAKR